MGSSRTPTTRCSVYLFEYREWKATFQKESGRYRGINGEDTSSRHFVSGLVGISVVPDATTSSWCVAEARVSSRARRFEDSNSPQESVPVPDAWAGRSHKIIHQVATRAAGVHDAESARIIRRLHAERVGG